MKATAVALAAVLAASPASAQINFVCYTASGQTYCNGQSQGFGESFANSFQQSQAIASNYAMVNAYREAHGLPRCHYGILGAIIAASNGEPMC